MMQIVFTLHQRVSYFQQVIDSWKNVRGIADIEIHAFIEPTPNLYAMESVISSSGLNIQVHRNPEKYGVLHNPWVALDYSFRERESDFTILAEEDLLVSSNVLEYFEWASKSFSPDEALGICVNSTEPVRDVSRSYLDSRFDVWIWGTWKQCWEDHLRDTWDHNYSTHNGTPGQEAGWDWNFGRISHQLGKPFVHSELSMSRHIGEHGGVHMTPQIFSRIQNPSFQLHQEPISYRR